MSKTVVYLIRHAEAEGNFIRRFHGITDSNVTEKGKLQAQKLAERLKNVHFDVIYSSPLKRAFYTASKIAEGRDIKIIVREDLIEINGGEWETGAGMNFHCFIQQSMKCGRKCLTNTVCQMVRVCMNFS